MACECASVCVCARLISDRDGVDFKCKQNGVLTSLVVWTMWMLLMLCLDSSGCGSCGSY